MKRHVLSILFLLFLLAPSCMKAATFSAAYSGDFFNPATWGNFDPNGPIPQDGDVVIIDGDFSVSIANASITLNSLTVADMGKLVVGDGSPSISVTGLLQVTNDATVLGVQIQLAGGGIVSGGVNINGFWEVADGGHLSIQGDINIALAQSLTFYNNEGGTLNIGGQTNIHCAAFADCYIVNIDLLYMNLTGNCEFEKTRIDNYGSFNFGEGHLNLVDGTFRNYANSSLHLAQTTTLTLIGGYNGLGYPEHVFGGSLSMNGANFEMTNTSASFVSINNLNSFSAYNSSFDIVGYHVSADNVVLEGNTILGPGGSFTIDETGLLDNNTWSSLDLQIGTNANVDFVSGSFLYGVDIDVTGTLNIAHSPFMTEGEVVLSIGFGGHVIGDSSNGDTGFDEGVAGLEINNNGEFRKIGNGIFRVEGIFESFAGGSVININQGTLLLQNGSLTSTAILNIKPATIFFNGSNGVANLGGTINASLGKLHTTSNTILNTSCTIGMVEVTSGTLQVNQNLTANTFNHSGGTTTYVTTGNHIGGGALTDGTVTGSGALVQIDGAFNTNNGFWKRADLTIANGATLQYTGTQFSEDVVLTNLGTINWSGGDWIFYDGCSLQNSGIWTMPSFSQSFYSLDGAASSVTNTGTINKSGNGGIFFNNAPFLNAPNGDINIGSGELAFVGGLTNNGFISIGSNAKLNLLGGTSNISGLVSAMNGTVLCSAGMNTFSTPLNVGKLDLQGGENIFQEDISSANLVVAAPSASTFLGASNATTNGNWYGGTLNLGSSPVSGKVLNLSGMLTWCSTVVKNGILEVLAGANINLGVNGSCGNGVLDGAQLSNHGSVNWVNGDFNMTGGSEITNHAEFNIFAQAAMNLNGSSTAEVFRNRGPLSKSSNADVRFVNVTLIQEAGGSLGVSLGKLILQCPFQNNAQTVFIGTGAILDICYDNTITGTINSPNGIVNVTAGNVLFNLPLSVGTFQALSGQTHLSQPLVAQYLEVLANAQLFFAPGTANSIATANLTNCELTLGEVGNPASLNMTGTSTWQGVTISNGTLNNSGTANLNGGLGTVAGMLQGAIFQNTGTVNWNGGDLVFSGAGSTINNSGIFIVSSNSNQSMDDLGVNSVFNNNAPGVFKHTTSSTLTIEPPFNNQAGATVGGIGTMNFNDFNDEGNVAPGMSPGLLMLAQGFDNTNGILKMEIGGTTPGASHDQLAVTGNVVLGGVVEVNFINGYTPANGAFILMTYTGAASGTLPMLTCATPGCVLGNLELQHDAGAKTLKLVVNASPLPIELLAFYARQDGKSALLTWQTATETNNDYFQIEHSLDGIDFREMGSVNAHGNSQEMETYSFIHETPYAGINYYRLKQVDFDGEYTYSNIISINVETNQISLFPNPTTGRVEIQGINTEEGTMRLKDNMGRLMPLQKLTDNNIDLSNLPNGVYFLELLDGGQSTVRRIVKE